MKIASMSFALPLVLAGVTAGGAYASSPDAWKAHDAKARAACQTASGLRAPHTCAPLVFSDTVGKTALLVTGVWPQRHMKGATATLLCLYDRRSGKAETVESPGWRVAR